MRRITAPRQNFLFCSPVLPASSPHPQVRRAHSYAPAACTGPAASNLGMGSPYGEAPMAHLRSSTRAASGADSPHSEER